jgi:hypothetical protein
MVLLGVAMVAGCAAHVLLVARAHDWHPLHVACPALMLLAMVDTCLLGADLVPGTAWAALLVLAAVAARVFAPVGRGAAHSLTAVAAIALLLALPAAAADDNGMAGMGGMHHAAPGVPDGLWWAALAAVVAIAAALAVRAVGHGPRARRVLALVGLVEVGLMAAMVLPATA